MTQNGDVEAGQGRGPGDDDDDDDEGPGDAEGWEELVRMRREKELGQR